jgi:hypothetical protein
VLPVLRGGRAVAEVPDAALVAWCRKLLKDVRSNPHPLTQTRLQRTVSDNITVRKMVTRFATSPPTDNCPQPKEALLTVSQL